MGRGSVAPASHVWLDAEAAGAIADFGPLFTGLLLCLGVDSTLIGLVFSILLGQTYAADPDR